MMGRPMDQAYFLRSSAAFASEPVISNTHAAATRSSSIIGSGGLSLWKSPLVDATASTAAAAAAAHQSVCNQRTRHAPPTTTACAALHILERFVEESSSSSSQLEERSRIPSNENENTKTSSTSTNVAMKGKITLRFARRSDIQSIHECNIITLPENYNTEFYQRHMRQWPDLALVAEHSPNDEEGEDDDKDGGSTRTPFINPLGNYEPSTADSSSRQIIGYVIGKVEQIPIPPKIEYDSNGMMIDNQGRWGSLGLRNTLPSRVQVGNDSGFSARSPPPQRQKQYELMGHITSIAILKDYRRNGLAAELMDQLHYEMRERYHAEAVSLHVRISNNAATRLYGKSMGYQVDHISHSYYADGEDAYYMKKPLGLPSTSPKYCLEQDEYYTDQSQQQVLQEGFTTQEEQQQSSQRRRSRLRFPRFNSNNNNDRNQFNMLPDQSVLKNKFELPRTVLNFDEKNQKQQSQPQPQLESHYNYNNSSMEMEPRAASIP
eukprot:CAMPEP_0178966618 /NCGR_PEP_ID=MMETSP0789-20121207/17030_1 /TAXON_ID=3005 /ORGANISM="Rhizosolenia setigera, Strain CCMP 1694" /LENGTH=490 /DNA_ID=CAMNT_0020651919 /DNA_START=109 /DNA_END=1582 /DNA_ORIENTATION=+